MKKLIECLSVVFFIGSTSVLSLAYVNFQLAEKQITASPVAQTTNKSEETK